MMIQEIIHNILKDHRDKITLDALESNLRGINVKVPLSKIISRENNISVIGNLVFLKSGLILSRENFLHDFESFIESKIQVRETVDDILNCYKVFIPDILFVEWMDISLERSLEVFYLLFSLIVKNKHRKDLLTNYFTKLTELYTETAVYAAVLDKNPLSQNSEVLESITKLEQIESKLNASLYEILINPDFVRLSIDESLRKLDSIETSLRDVMDETFEETLKYSTTLFKRVINTEIRRFNPLFLLKRFEFASFYEWIIFVAEESDGFPMKRLIDDLEIT